MKKPISVEDSAFFDKVLDLMRKESLPAGQVCALHNISYERYNAIIENNPELSIELTDFLEGNNHTHEHIISTAQSGLSYNLAPQIEITETTQYDADGVKTGSTITTRTVPPNINAIKFALTKLDPAMYGNSTQSGTTEFVVENS